LRPSLVSLGQFRRILDDMQTVGALARALDDQSVLGNS
jgi:hypothetical protein